MIERELKDALVSLQQAIGSSNSSVISAGLKRLDSLLVSNGSELPPQLRHFLERRSYQKALMYLEGEGDIPKGVCGGKGY